MDTDRTPRAGAYGGGRGPRGRGWVIAAFYVFAAIVLTGWAEGWWQNSPHATAPQPGLQQTTHG